MNAIIANTGTLITHLVSLLNVSGISKDVSNTLTGDFAPRRIRAVNRNVGDYIVLGGFPGR